MTAAAQVVFASAALADGASPSSAGTLRTAGTPVEAAGKECYCRVDGRAYFIGESACIRGRIATCGMYLNNTSWDVTDSPCPISRLSPADPAMRASALVPLPRTPL